MIINVTTSLRIVKDAGTWSIQYRQQQIDTGNGRLVDVWDGLITCTGLVEAVETLKKMLPDPQNIEALREALRNSESLPEELAKAMRECG